MTKKEQHTTPQIHSHKKFFGGKILTGILLAIVLVALAAFIFAIAPITDSEKIEIAALLPLSGDYTEMGKTYQKGIDLAVADLQNRGKNIEVIYFDTKGNPNVALDSFFTIIDSNISAVIGPTTTAETEIIAPYAEMYNKPLITYATGSSLSKYKNYIFRFNPSNNNFCKAIIDIVKDFGESNLSVVWSETSLGKSSFDNINEVASKENINIISIPITSIGDVINKLNETKTNIAYIEGASSEQVSQILMAQQHANVSHPYLWVTSDSGFGNSIRDLNFDMGHILVLVPTVSTAETKFLENYREKYGTEFDVSDGYLLHGYDALMTLASSVPSRGESSGKIIADNLRKYRYLGLTGPVFFDEGLQRFPLYELYMPNNGQWSNIPLLELRQSLEKLLASNQADTS